MWKNKENIIIKYYKKEKGLLCAFIFFNIAVTILDLTAPLVVKNIIDTAIPSKNIKILLTLTSFALFLYGVRTLFAVMSFSERTAYGEQNKIPHEK